MTSQKYEAIKEAVKDELRLLLSITPDTPGTTRNALMKWLSKDEPKKEQIIIHKKI